MDRTHITWSIERNDACPTCGSPTVLVSAPTEWAIDEEDRTADSYAVEVSEEVTGHYCLACCKLVSLSLNT